ncbi:MAG: hypothetical protein E3J70_06010 [Candidatus Heimdallarchaeota archaeon]|nr:MAG: hypothetical protein E3J70_06010 [Candidatus Heimdallarchaeota archaeon]
MVDEMIKLLESGVGENITKAAKALSEKAKDVVELPKDRLKKILQMLNDALDKPNVDDGEVRLALDTITNEMILKYDIIIPEKQAISYEWFVAWLDDQ